MLLDTTSAELWANYEFPPSFILGFHGCDAKLGESILSGNTTHLAASENDYDWLGKGIYFWEGNPSRAMQFASERSAGGRNSKGEISNPFVLGAVINLGRCLDLADSTAIVQVQKAYRSYQNLAKASNKTLPSNGESLKTRKLDCLIFNWLHYIREQQNSIPYDTVRGLFWEGPQIYPNAGVREANHIQICVRDISCILGYFRPIPSNASG